MKTDDLIRAMSADTTARQPVEAALPGAVLLIAALAGFVFLGEMGVRADLASALGDPLVIVKQLFPVVLALGAFWAVVRMSRPGSPVPAAALLVMATVPVALGFAAIYEAMILPQEAWGMAFVGKSRVECLTYVVTMSLPILAGSLWALRRGASLHPALSGALAGLLSGGTAASVYALYCTEDSPFFYAVWYMAGILAVTALGALLGSRLLRW
jgi:hypothetical protein